MQSLRGLANAAWQTCLEFTAKAEIRLRLL